PVSVTVPSSTVMPLAAMLDGLFMVNAPVASLPAEKMPTSPAANVVAADAPVESVVQRRPVVFHVPAPVPCPEPAVAPLMSHHLFAACAGAAHRAKASRQT